MQKKICVIVLFALSCFIYAGYAYANGLRPVDLQCEYLVNPLGMDEPEPRLSWILESDRRGDEQTACRIIVSESREDLRAGIGSAWDSGIIESSRSLNIPYAGRPLKSGTRYYWSVMCRDKNGSPTPWSAAAFFETGLMRQSGWNAQWIAADTSVSSPLFRKEFPVGKPVRKARAYVTGLGYYELYLNGRKVGDRLLDPAWTPYRERIYYAVYDVAEYLQSGDNAAGIMLGNGWYNTLPLKMWGRFILREHLLSGRPRAIMRLDIEYEDGTTEQIVTDGSWKTDAGPVVSNDVYLGEVYDARREQPGWNTGGFNGSGWKSAETVPAPGGRLTAQAVQPIRITKRIKPVCVTEPEPGVYVFDMGQNFGGLVQLRVKGARGKKVVLRYAELLGDDGMLNVMTSVAGQIKGGRIADGPPEQPETAWQTDTYILKGKGEEVWHPRFVYHGFRYVEVTGLPGPPDIQTVEGLRMNSAVARTGSFSCSNELINTMQDMVEWTYLSNMFSVQSDCPHREKYGYGGDLIATIETALHNFDMRQFYTKTMWDFADEIDRENGAVTELAPFMGIADGGGLSKRGGPPGWGTVYLYLPWQMYLYYGDTEVLEEHYDGMKGWLSYLGSLADNYILSNGIGDHESVVEKTIPFTSTAFYFWSARLLADIADVLDKPADAGRYRKLAEEIKTALNGKFYQSGTGRYKPFSQAHQSFGLMLGLIPEGDRDKALSALIEDIVITRKGHVSSGIFGTKFTPLVLMDRERSDIAYGMLTTRSFPGWGYMIENGATTFWEHWAYDDKIFSHNHPMFGEIGEWFYKALAGIRIDPSQPAYKNIIIKPNPVNDLTSAEGTLETVRGTVCSAWRKTGDCFELSVRIPANASADVYLPVAQKVNPEIRESGSVVYADGEFRECIEGVSGAVPGSDYIKLHTGCGSYVFTVR